MPKATQGMSGRASTCPSFLASKTPNYTTVSPPKSSRPQAWNLGLCEPPSSLRLIFSTPALGPHWALEPGSLLHPLHYSQVIFLQPQQLGVPAPHFGIQGHSPSGPCLLLQPQVLANTARTPRVLQGLTSFVWFPSPSPKHP